MNGEKLVAIISDAASTGKIQLVEYNLYYSLLPQHSFIRSTIVASTNIRIDMT